MSEKQKKILIISLIALAVIAAAVWRAYVIRKNERIGNIRNGNPSSDTLNDLIDYSDQKNASSTIEQGQKTSLVSALTLDQALKKYPNRIEFNNCRGAVGRQSVSTLVLKQFSQWLLQNNDEKIRKYVFGRQSFTIKPYGFVVVTAKEVGELTVFCDNFPGAKVIVQK